MAEFEEKARDSFTRKWIIENSKKILETYTEGITLRQLYYRLFAMGMTNDIQHYKRVVSAMTNARWDSDVDVEAFIDRERSMYGRTEADEKDLESEIERAKDQVKAWMNSYHLNKWSNQKYYIEVWIEKKALQGVFETPCMMAGIGLCPCKGYPSITFLNDAMKRFRQAINKGKEVVMLYYGDYDSSGSDIPRSIQENLSRLGVDIEVKRIALNPDQIKALGLPGVPPKVTDSRTRNWDGKSAVELDSLDPKILAKMAEDSIAEYFDEDLYAELQKTESAERVEYRKALKDFVNNMKDSDEGDE